MLFMTGKIATAMGPRSKVRRRLAGFIAACALLLELHETFAQTTITLAPAAPTSGDLIRATLNQVPCVPDPYKTRVTMAGNRITIAFVDSPYPFECPPANIETVIGQLPVGNYDVVATREAYTANAIAAPLGGPQAFSVKDGRQDPAVRFPQDNFTGIWWDPAEPGWGMSIFQQRDGRLIAAWYTADSSSNPTWVTLQGSSWDSDRGVTASGTIYRTRARYFAAPFLGSANVPPYFANAQEVGTWSLNFILVIFPGALGSEAIFRFNVDGIAGEKRIQRFPS